MKIMTENFFGILISMRLGMIQDTSQIFINCSKLSTGNTSYVTNLHILLVVLET
jgi:hypothetical protein